MGNDDALCQLEAKQLEISYFDEIANLNRNINRYDSRTYAISDGNGLMSISINEVALPEFTIPTLDASSAYKKAKVHLARATMSFENGSTMDITRIAESFGSLEQFLKLGQTYASTNGKLCWKVKEIISSETIGSYADGLFAAVGVDSIGKVKHLNLILKHRKPS